MKLATAFVESSVLLRSAYSFTLAMMNSLQYRAGSTQLQEQPQVCALVLVLFNTTLPPEVHLT